MHFSVKRAKDALGVSKPTAIKAFDELSNKGFIDLVNQHEWLNGRAREWRLTYLPYKGREPTDEWEDWRSEKILG